MIQAPIKLPQGVIAAYPKPEKEGKRKSKKPDKTKQ